MKIAVVFLYMLIVSFQPDVNLAYEKNEYVGWMVRLTKDGDEYSYIALAPKFQPDDSEPTVWMNCSAQPPPTDPRYDVASHAMPALINDMEMDWFYVGLHTCWSGQSYELYQALIRPHIHSFMQGIWVGIVIVLSMIIPLKLLSKLRKQQV